MGVAIVIDALVLRHITARFQAVLKTVHLIRHRPCESDTPRIGPHLHEESKLY